MGSERRLNADPFLTQNAAVDQHVHNVANDPFLTHAMPAQWADTDVRADPFLLAPPHAPVKLPRESWLRRADRCCHGDLFAGLSCDFFSCLGDLEGVRVPVDTLLLPWAAFVVVLLAGLFLRHWSRTAWACLLVAFLASQVLAVARWLWRGRPASGVTRVTRAVMTFAMAIAGCAVAGTLWHHYMRQYWWMHTGVRYDSALTTASTPAEGRADAAWVRFAGPASGSPAGNLSVVDTSRAAGYRDGSIYCAAPVMSSASFGSSVVRVNYWAVGIDCCQGSGSFTCDAARSSRGEYGVPLLSGGMPCAGCNAARFEQAVRKAEALFGVVSAPGALRIRWVASAADAQRDLGRKVLTCFLFAAFVAFLATAIMAVVVAKVQAAAPLGGGGGGAASLGASTAGPATAA